MESRVWYFLGFLLLRSDLYKQQRYDATGCHPSLSRSWRGVASQTQRISLTRIDPVSAFTDGYVPKLDTIGVFPRLGENIDDAIYAVMKDGSRIKLDLAGNDVLQAETPIVLSQLDYILLEDGTKLFAPSIQP